MNNKHPQKSKLLAMCFSWKTLVMLGVFGGGLFFFLSPAKALVAAPFLLFALCPLSMIFMMFKMKDKEKDETH
jgi:cbb3-type cytochrome oxidase subunit 3